MNRLTLSLTVSLSAILLSSPLVAEGFTLTSKGVSHGRFMDKRYEFKGFGCDGSNKSPHLAWSGAPEGTKAFAVTVYDPDAPTGSGWWHWQLVNIPATVNSLPSGAGELHSKKIPKGSLQIDNDYGFAGFGGACPPVGHGAHRYQFTVYALSQKLELPEQASGALTGYMIKSMSLGSASIEALYQR